MANHIVKNITQKDEMAAMNAARMLLNTADVDAFEELCEKSDFLFDFVRDNVCRRLYNAADINNYKNVLKFFVIYDETYSDVFAKILLNFGDEKLQDVLLSLLQNGDTAQKAYCAKYFEKKPEEKALPFLNNEAFADDEGLCVNAVKALAAAKNREGLYKAYEKLAADDGFECLKGIRFLMVYPDLSRIDDVVNAAVNCSVPENAAEEIANAVDFYEFIKEKQSPERLLLLNSIVNGMGEILPVSNIIYYKFFDVIRFLINQSYEEENSQIAQILWNMRVKFKLLFENDEYTYDEEIETKNELKRIFALLNNQGDDFWKEQMSLVRFELNQDEKRVAAALNLIKEIGEFDYIDYIVSLTNSGNELIVCLAVETLKLLGRTEDIDFERIVSRIRNENIRAIIKSMCVNNS